MTFKKCPICGANLKKIGEKEVIGRTFEIFEDCVNCEENLKKQKVQEIVEIKKKKRQEMYDKLVASNIGRKYYHNTFDNMELVSPSFENALNRAKKYCENIQECLNRGLGIYFFGKNGRGKTAIVSCMIHELIKLGYSPYFTTLGELQDDIINRRKTKEEIKSKQILFLDDIGTEKATSKEEISFSNDLLFEIVLYRDKNLLPTIFTSNLLISELFKHGIMLKTIERIKTLGTAKIEIITPASFRLKEEKQKIPF